MNVGKSLKTYLGEIFAVGEIDVLYTMFIYYCEQKCKNKYKNSLLL